MMFFSIALGIFMAIFIQRATDFGWILTLIFLVSYVLSQIYRTMLGVNFSKMLESGMSFERIQTKVQLPAAISSVLMWALITSIIDNLKIFS